MDIKSNLITINKETLTNQSNERINLIKSVLKRNDARV